MKKLFYGLGAVAAVVTPVVAVVSCSKNSDDASTKAGKQLLSAIETFEGSSADNKTPTTYLFGENLGQMVASVLDAHYEVTGDSQDEKAEEAVPAWGGTIGSLEHAKNDLVAKFADLEKQLSAKDTADLKALLDLCIKNGTTGNEGSRIQALPASDATRIAAFNKITPIREAIKSLSYNAAFAIATAFGHPELVTK